MSRYDGAAWRTFTTADGLTPNSVVSILEDRSGNLWFGTNEGVSRYDGAAWRTFTTADGLASNFAFSILEDRLGNLWFGTYFGGVSRYDGNTWRTFSTADGLASNDVFFILEDRSGHLWFAAYGDRGVSRYEPDRVPPRPVFLSAPNDLSPSRNQSAVFVAAFGEPRIEFSYQLDAAAWSDWSPINSWFRNDLADGIHVLAVRARDFLSNLLRRLILKRQERRTPSPRGFSLIELLIGISILAIALLSIATMFSTGYTDVTVAGKPTLAASAARQMIEDMQTLPFERLLDLNNFNTNLVGSLPAPDAALDPGRTTARNIARKWRYTLAGDSAGWGFTMAERASWSTLSASGIPLGAQGQIAVISPGGSPTLRRVTVTVLLPGRTPGATVPVQLITLISRL